MHTVLVIGGYGFFGARICGALAKNPLVHLLIGGRNRDRALRKARQLGLQNDRAVCVDAGSSVLHELFRKYRVETVIHTAGPFQGQDYTVARAAIDAGCHYIDLADGRQFVAGIGALDSSARARGVTVVSGASSVPALSSAVVDRYLPEFDCLESIRIAISSGARAPGIATVRGVLSYAGKPIKCLQRGSWINVYGWRGLERHEFPAPLGRRWLGSCEVPDLELLPQRYETAKTVTFQAGFASDAGHLVIWALAGLVKTKLLSSIVAFASPLNRISRWIEPLVSDKGGMFVILEGKGHDGQKRRINWNLIAERNCGPFIPCGASIVLATKLAQGVNPAVGAMPCMGLVTLPEYLEALSGLDVREVVT